MSIRVSSTVFVKELLDRRFDVTWVYTDVGVDDAAEYRRLVAEHKPEIIFFLQVYCNAAIMAELGLPGIWMPMFDSVNKRFDDRFIDSVRVGGSVLALAHALGDICRFWRLRCPRRPVLPKLQGRPQTSRSATIECLFGTGGGVQPAEVAPVLKSIPGLSVVIKHDPDPPYVDTPREDGELAASFVERVVEGFLL